MLHRAASNTLASTSNPTAAWSSHRSHAAYPSFRVARLQATASLTIASPPGRQEAKEALFSGLAGTSRGGAVSPAQRGSIEEAQVALEAFGKPLDFDLLAGTWELVYTTAPDVAPLVAPLTSTGPLQVGRIFQRFGALDGGRSGSIDNVIQFSVWGLTAEDAGLTLTVGARFEPRGDRSIVLFFEDINLGKIHMSDGLQALLAPALLPRGWLNQQLLLGINEFSLTLPLAERPLLGNGRKGSAGSAPANKRSGAAGYYLLTYLDEDTLVGRQQAGGGGFIFKRVEGV